jgi:hypothetical protein
VLLKKRFCRVEELKSMKPQVGKTLMLNKDGNYIAHLATKKRYWTKPTKDDFKSQVKDHNKQLQERGITKVVCVIYNI